MRTKRRGWSWNFLTSISLPAGFCSLNEAVFVHLEWKVGHMKSTRASAGYIWLPRFVRNLSLRTSKRVFKDRFCKDTSAKGPLAEFATERGGNLKVLFESSAGMMRHRHHRHNRHYLKMTSRAPVQSPLRTVHSTYGGVWGHCSLKCACFAAGRA